MKESLLHKLRCRIDWIDEQITRLLEERMKVIEQVGRAKKDAQIEVLDEGREKQLLERIQSRAQHPIFKADVVELYQTIMRSSKIAQQFLMGSDQPFKKIGVIGLGLIGGSVCQAIKIKDSSIEILSLINTQMDLKDLVERGWIDKICDSIEDLVSESDLIVLASPISTIIPYAKKIQKAAQGHPGLIVIDVASVKQEIVKEFESLTQGSVEFIGTHPMAGKENSGFNHSQATLFVARRWVITPHHNNTICGLERVQSFIGFLGAECEKLSPDNHDLFAACISHLPLLIATSYFRFVSGREPQSLRMAGPGFDSFTRLARSDSTLYHEIVSANQHLLKDILRDFIPYLSRQLEMVL